jgi:hypothetical protein
VDAIITVFSTHRIGKTIIGRKRKFIEKAEVQPRPQKGIEYFRKTVVPAIVGVLYGGGAAPPLFQ